MSSWPVQLLEAMNVLVLVYFALLNVVYLVMILLAFRELRKFAKRAHSFDISSPAWATMAPPVTILVPVHNEESTCVETVQALLTLIYPRHEVIVIDDGSTDGTVARLRSTFDLVPSARAPTADFATADVEMILRSRRHRGLWVVKKVSGGKADALNAGLNYCHTPMFCTIDGDTLVEREALLRMVRPFLFDSRTVAAGGIVRVVNGCRVENGTVREVRMPHEVLPGLQVVEYLRAFLMGRIGWAEAGSTLIISGAFGMFRRDVVVSVGGYSTDTVGEDMELVVRIHRVMHEQEREYQVDFVPDPVAWTEVPRTFLHLAGQRDRWQRGLIESLVAHRRMFCRPAYGRIGLVAFPYFLFFEMVGPVIEFLGYLAFAVAALLGLVSIAHAILFLTLAVGVGTAISIGVLALEELTFRRYSRNRDLLALFALGVLENLGYRQLITAFRMRGTFSALLGRTDWGRGRGTE